MEQKGPPSLSTRGPSVTVVLRSKAALQDCQATQEQSLAYVSGVQQTHAPVGIRPSPEVMGMEVVQLLVVGALQVAGGSA